MAQWQALLKLDSALQDRVRQLYDGRFSIEVRQWLSCWIESRDWDSAATDESEAATCFQALLEHLQERWSRSVQENNILQGPNFLRMREYVFDNFQTQPVNLALLLSECLKEEKKILSSVTTTPTSSCPVMMPQWTDLDNKVTQMKLQILDLKKEVKILEDLSEKLEFIQNTWQIKVEQNIGLAQSHALVEKECQNRQMTIARAKNIILQRFVAILDQVSKITATLTGVELPEWKRRQQLACIGSPENTSLELLQQWFTTMAEVLFGVREQLQRLQTQINKNTSSDSAVLSENIAVLDHFSLTLIRNLLTEALVVETQPVMQSLPHRPLILKIAVSFKVTVRFLANLPAFKGLLKVKAVFDKDVEEVKRVSGFRLFNFTFNDSKILDVDSPDGALIAAFQHMSLKRKTTRTKGSCESPLMVTEELHIIRFHTALNHAGEKIEIETSSLPVVVICNSNQVTGAWASIMWFNMLSAGKTMNLSLFLDPPALTWQQLAALLTWQFLSVGQRPLDSDQLSMLRDRIMDDPKGLVHWNKFSKDENVWVWIDGILDLIRKYLPDLWREGYIMGFVSKQRTRTLLMNKPPGTFLIRFSESIRDGAITFSWVDNSTGVSQVHAVEPYTKRQLALLTLPEAINNYTLTSQGGSCKPLIYLYPDIPKDLVFGRYCKVSEMSPTKTDKENYIRTKIVLSSIGPTPPPSPQMDFEPDTSEDFGDFDFMSDLGELPQLSISLESLHCPGFDLQNEMHF